MAAAFPISGSVGCGLHARPEGTQKSLLIGVDDNAHVPGPYDQITRLRMIHAFEAGHALIQDARRRIAVVESGALKEPLDEVGTVEISGFDLLAHADEEFFGRERGQKSAGLVNFRNELGQDGGHFVLSAKSGGAGN